jgi:hypothetical protein
MGRARRSRDIQALLASPAGESPMRMPTFVFVVAGAALILLGGFLLFEGGYTTHRQVLEIGSVNVSADQKSTVSPWVAAAAILGGVALLFATVRKKA